MAQRHICSFNDSAGRTRYLKKRLNKPEPSMLRESIMLTPLIGFLFILLTFVFCFSRVHFSNSSMIEDYGIRDSSFWLKKRCQSDRTENATVVCTIVKN